MSPEVENLVRSTVQKIRQNGGRVIGLIGFSQGTKVVAGLLRASELRAELVGTGQMQADEEDWCDFKMGISVCGSYPPLLMPPFIAARVAEDKMLKEKITTPAFHVQGKQDEWMWAGQGLIEKHYEMGEGMSEVVTWDMGHHYPVQPEESERIAEWMVKVLKKVEAGEKEMR
jgi:predicted esterase